MCFVFNLLIVLYNLNANLEGKLLQWAVNIINGAAIYLEIYIRNFSSRLFYFKAQFSIQL